MNDALISLSVPNHIHVISAHDLEEKMWFIIKKKKLLMLTKGRKTWTSFILLYFPTYM